MASYEKRPCNIGLLTFPISNSGLTPLSNLVNILSSLSDKIYLITGSAGYEFFADDQKICTYRVEHTLGSNIFTRAINYFLTQLKISYNLIKLRNKVDVWIFFIGGEGLTLPMLTAKLLRKKVAIASAGSGWKVAQARKDLLTKVLVLLQSITYSLTDKIVLYSPNLIEEGNLQKYRNKISIAHEHFLNFDKFKVEKQLNERDDLIGYIGRLSEEKGILNFIEAIPKILEIENGLKIFIGGDGQLRGKVEQCLREKNLDSKVQFTGWIPHDELPKYLNELRLLVLPSYTEGLPNIMLEAMACGTPVLATPVGAIPDIIKDGETGFIMENNSPECIAKNIIRALNHPNLEQISQNARALVEKEFTFSYFETEEEIDNPDIILNIGKFTPSNNDCYIVDYNYYIKDNYIYCKDFGGTARWEMEIFGFEEGKTVINYDDGKILGPEAIFYPDLLPQDILLRPLIEYKLSKKGYLLLHGAGISKDNQGYILSGRGSSFKTSLCMDFVRKGKFDFLGDDKIIISNEGKILSFPVHLKAFEFKVNNLNTESFRDSSNSLTFSSLVKFSNFIRYLYNEAHNKSHKIPLTTSSMLKAIFLIVRTNIQDVRIKEETNIERVAKRLAINNLADIIKGHTFMLFDSGQYFYKYVLAYSFVFPDCEIIEHWKDLQKELKEILKDVTVYEIKIPQKYNSNIVEKILEIIGGK